jgi:hypothetical protein
MQRKIYRNISCHGNHVALAEEYFALFVVLCKRSKETGGTEEGLNSSNTLL